MKSTEKKKFVIKNPYLYVMVTFIVAGASFLVSGIFTTIYTELMLKVVPQNDWTMNLIELSGFIFITILAIVSAHFIQKISWEKLGFKRRGAVKDFLKGWVVGALILIVCVVIMMLLGAVEITGIQINSRIILQFIPLVAAWSIQANAEEVFTRGWIFGTIGRKINILAGIIISSAIFTAMHLENEGIALLPLLDLSLFGVFAALYMIKTDNIWAVSGFHAAWNCFQGNVFAFPVSGSTTGDAFIQVTVHGSGWLTGGGFGVEGSIVSILVQVVLITWLCYDLFIKNKINIIGKYSLGAACCDDVDKLNK